MHCSSPSRACAQILNSLAFSTTARSGGFQTSGIPRRWRQSSISYIYINSDTRRSQNSQRESPFLLSSFLHLTFYLLNFYFISSVIRFDGCSSFCGSFSKASERERKNERRGEGIIMMMRRWFCYQRVRGVRLISRSLSPLNFANLTTAFSRHLPVITARMSLPIYNRAVRGLLSWIYNRRKGNFAAALALYRPASSIYIGV